MKTGWIERRKMTLSSRELEKEETSIHLKGKWNLSEATTRTQRINHRHHGRESYGKTQTIIYLSDTQLLLIFTSYVHFECLKSKVNSNDFLKNIKKLHFLIGWMMETGLHVLRTWLIHLSSLINVMFKFKGKLQI